MSSAKSSSSTVLAAAIGLFATATGLYVYHKRQQRFVPPVAKRQNHTVMVGSHPVMDDLFWLRDDKRKDASVIKHLEKENIYTHAMTEHLGELRKSLFNEFITHLKEDDF